MPTDEVDMSARYFCTRAMMQEPHCLNTSILDCSVTFTVDRVRQTFPRPVFSGNFSDFFRRK
jgi:hypothetical protein